MEEAESELLALYDDTMRRNANVSGCVREQTQSVSRYTTSTGSQRYLMWHDCHDADAARLVDEELRAVHGHARVLMWKLYAHDVAHDAVHAALIARGFDGDDYATLMVTPVAALLAALPANDKRAASLDARQLHTAKDLDAYQNIWDEVWPDEPNARYVDDYKSRIEQRDPGALFYAGFAENDNPVSSGSLFHHPGNPYALLCGGTTKTAWRRQHAYTSMLAVRAHASAARGVRYLAVEASAESQPILARLSFMPLSTLTFYERDIDAG